jgi:hypothetical protein
VQNVLFIPSMLSNLRNYRFSASVVQITDYHCSSNSLSWFTSLTEHSSKMVDKAHPRAAKRLSMPSPSPLAPPVMSIVFFAAAVTLYGALKSIGVEE